MSNFYTILLTLACLAVAINALESPRSRYRGRLRFLARQEQAEPVAVTPYPSASELKPEVPFEEVEESASERIVPDAVYGPPIANDDAPQDEQLDNEDEEAQAAAADGSGDSSADSDDSQAAVENEAPVVEQAPQRFTAAGRRLVFPRRNFNQRARPAKLQTFQRFRQ